MSRTTKISVGSIQVTALRDGELYLPKEALVNLREEDAAIINDSENSKLIYGNVNAYLIQSANRNLLIDAGCRELFGPTCGFLKDAIKETGLELNDITDLFFTHLHPDHIAGAINTDGKAIFENAALQVLESEHDFWIKNNFDPIEVNGADWANLASGVLSAYNDKKEILWVDHQFLYAGIRPQRKQLFKYEFIENTVIKVISSDMSNCFINGLPNASNSDKENKSGSNGATSKLQPIDHPIFKYLKIETNSYIGNPKWEH